MPGCGITGPSAIPSTSSSASAATTTSTTWTPIATSSTTSSARSCCPPASSTSAQNPAAAGFVNQRIVYTHGIGAALVPVNEVTNEGQPRLFIRNLPPVSSEGAPEITEPRIYFGEKPSGYVITGARQAEFDYPTGEGEGGADPGTETRWRGTTGIDLDTTLPRLLFALRFRDLDLLISDQITAESQLLFHRSLADRLEHIAPFLRYDKDPYLVIRDDGTLTYVQDAFTVSDRFPHAQGFDPGGSGLEGTRLGDPFNYIRNSVKITMDAYDGTMNFYVADDQDPLIRAYSGVFPTMFQPLTAIPADLRPHLRVPEEQFNVQTRVFGRYHVRDPLRFFQSDDLWTVPTAQGSTQSLPNEAYYVIMRMPGEEEAEFLLLQPMVPLNRPNMIAWVAARQDAPNYGATRVYRFPADTTIFGPAQIEARIVQDPQISQQFTLWSQGGSTVIQGNLIVVPVGDSLIYLQPVYLQSQQSAFPEFQRIIVASPREVVWSETLGGGARPPAGGRGQRAWTDRAAHPHADAVAWPDPDTGPDPVGWSDRSVARRRPRPGRVRQPPLRARAGGAARRGLRPVRRGDRQGRGRPAAARRARTRTGARVARAVGQPRAMTVGATLVASLLLALAGPRTWPLALATFLLRGGILLVLAPIVVLPSAVAVGNVLTPLLSNVVFRGVATIAVPLAVLGFGALLWLCGGGLIAAAAESELARTVAQDDEAWPAGRAPRDLAPAAHPAWRVLTVRLIAHLPLLLALSWGAIRIVAVTYRELTVPSDVGGGPRRPGRGRRHGRRRRGRRGVAARRDGRRDRRAPGHPARRTGPEGAGPGRPSDCCATRCAASCWPLVPLVVLLLVLVAVGLAGSATWDALRAALSFGTDGVTDGVAALALVGVLVALFAGGLVLIGVISAWRAAVWTVDWAGTFGGAGYDPEGQWNSVADSATLHDLRPRGVDPDPR